MNYTLLDPLLLTTILLLLVTLGAAALYHWRIKAAHGEYEEARDIVGDVVLSFNKELQRQDERLRAVAYKTEAFSSKFEDAMKKVKDHDRQLKELVAKVEATSGIKQEASVQIEKLNKKVESIIETQKNLMQKIAEAPTVPEARIETAIPIKKEKALAPLTETELSALEFLATEGEKTAPEIKNQIKLTREHTARLMKKLYEKGYLERDTQKMPYTYRVKKEMQKILRKIEAKA